MTKKITDLEGRLDAALKRGDKKTKQAQHTPGRGMYYGQHQQDEAEQAAADFRYRKSILGDEAWS